MPKAQKLEVENTEEQCDPAQQALKLIKAQMDMSIKLYEEALAIVGE